MAEMAMPARSGLRIAIAIDVVDWHSRALIRALSACGARGVPFKLSEARFDTSAGFGVHIPGFGDALPDAVLTRAISGGSFEAVTLRLGILHALRALGVPVWNDARAIERCVDKSTTSFLLARAGLPTPATWTVESPDAAAALVRQEIARAPLVCKPLFGSQGRGLRLIRRVEDLPSADVMHGVYYLQRFVGVDDNGFRDMRLLVSRGRVIAAMLRHADTWITNIKRGGRPLALVVDEEVRGLAIAATAAVGANFAGVDILRDAEGRLWLLEVNSMPAWRGLQTVTNENIAAVLAGDLLDELHATALRQAAV